ncbi:MAG: DUF6760 family protein [Leptolyngbyaceae cyanobacterium bins.349]|nr:DUF6760 family protein [Leptolyngbyaceae cyanobacterium bins.349]
MSSPVSNGVGVVGGVLSYPLERLHQEVAFIALHFHWSLADILALEHHDRRRWVQEIQALSEQR